MQKKIKNIIINIVLQAFLIIILIFAGCCNENLVSSEENLRYTIGEALISDDFSGNLSQWSIEGAMPQIVDGGMELNTPAFSAAWLKPSLMGNVLIEFDVTVIASNDSEGSAGSFGCFAMATDPANLNKFFAAGKERAGNLSKYKNNLTLYYIELDCNKKKSLKILRCSDGKQELISKSANSSYKKASGGKYHFKLLFFEKTIELYLNDSRLFRYEDSQPYTKGNFGLTASASRIVIDNFVITHLLRP
ncbi:MAG: hypothetical protein JW787_15635 [Sedimentisphaerales bacterium]|nr:hypothetical protein [Sedimentisphaerales bacterium]